MKEKNKKTGNRKIPEKFQEKSQKVYNSDGVAPTDGRCKKEP